MSFINEPAGDVRTSACANSKNYKVVCHPFILGRLKQAQLDFDPRIIHVLPEEECPAGLVQIITYFEGKFVAVKDHNGMTGIGGYYCIDYRRD